MSQMILESHPVSQNTEDERILYLDPKYVEDITSLRQRLLTDYAIKLDDKQYKSLKNEIDDRKHVISERKIYGVPLDRDFVKSMTAHLRLKLTKDQLKKLNKRKKMEQLDREVSGSFQQMVEEPRTKLKQKSSSKTTII